MIEKILSILCLLFVVAMAMPPEPVRIVGDDGDSGRLYGPNYAEDGTKFRLSQFDAPEISKPLCERERRRGYAAKGAAEALTADAVIAVGRETQPPDRWGRIVVPIAIDGDPLGETLAGLGQVRPWPHDAKGRPSGKKPNWCN